MTFWDYLVKVEARGWAAMALFTLATMIFIMLDQNPALEKNQLFSNLSVLVIGSGGLLAVISFYFGSSSGSAKKDETITALSNKNPNPSPDPSPKP